MSEEPYRGPCRRLVLALDVGTTYSGISYCFLEPGCVPKIRSVTRYPGQEHIASSSKIPTIIYYDKLGNVKTAGAETELDQVVEEAEDEGWLKVQWFKLRLRPRSMSTMPLKHLTPLPRGKTATDVMSDFLRYLMTCAENFIKDAHATYIPTWPEFRAKATFVIAHPNGWEGAQQARYRKAAIQAGLVPDTDEGKSRVVFVTEGEASLHFCLKGDHISRLKTNVGFIVADMGGGTLDFSAYKTVGLNPLQVEEMAKSRCELQGGSLVTERANAYVKNKLRSSRYGDPGIVGRMTDVFDRMVKQVFRTVDTICYLTFGNPSDRDMEHDIRSGRLKLQAEHVAQFFEPSVDASVRAILAQAEESTVAIEAVYLVGGFSASPYLVSILKERLGKYDITVHATDGQGAKAVAEGSISFFIDHYVVARIAKTTYLTSVSRKYNFSDKEHRKRVKSIFRDVDGVNYVRGGLSVILSQGTRVTEETEFSDTVISNHLLSARTKNPDFIKLYRYRGAVSKPNWVDEIDFSDLSTACTIRFPKADYSHASMTGVNQSSQPYTTLIFQVSMKFGGPELQAQIVWRGKDGEKRSPAEIIYEFDEEPDDGILDDENGDDCNESARTDEECVDSGSERELNSATQFIRLTKLDTDGWA